MSLYPSLRAYSALLVFGAVLGAGWLGVVIWQRVERASSLEDICRDGSGQGVNSIRARATSFGLAVHESAGSILLSVATPVPPGTLFCRFSVNGQSVYGAEQFVD